MFLLPAEGLDLAADDAILALLFPTRGLFQAEAIGTAGAL
jgi:hypothetical protein